MRCSKLSNCTTTDQTDRLLVNTLQDRLHDGETAEEENPNQPADNGEVSNDQPCHRQTVPLQLWPGLDPGEGNVSANYSGDSREHDRGAAKPKHPEQAENKRQDGERLGRSGWRRYRCHGAASRRGHNAWGCRADWRRRRAAAHAGNRGKRRLAGRAFVPGLIGKAYRSGSQLVVYLFQRERASRFPVARDVNLHLANVLRRSGEGKQKLLTGLSLL